MPFDKYATINNLRNTLNESMLRQMSRYAELQAAINDLVVEPSEATAAEVDDVFSKINEDLMNLRNGITTLANVIVSPTGEVEEVAVFADENGTRFL